MDEYACLSWSIFLDKSTTQGAPAAGAAAAAKADTDANTPSRVECLRAVLQPLSFFGMPRATITEDADGAGKEVEEPCYFQVLRSFLSAGRPHVLGAEEDPEHPAFSSQLAV